MTQDEATTSTGASEAEEVEGQGGEGKKLSMEERQKKLEQLRAKMVRSLSYTLDRRVLIICI